MKIEQIATSASLQYLVMLLHSPQGKSNLLCENSCNLLSTRHFADEIFAYELNPIDAFEHFTISSPKNSPQSVINIAFQFSSQSQLHQLRKRK